MIDRSEFTKWKEEAENRGRPFTLDGAAAPDGSNAHLRRFYSRKYDFRKNNVAGESVWLNPPFRKIASFLRHYEKCKEQDPKGTSC